MLEAGHRRPSPIEGDVNEVCFVKSSLWLTRNEILFAKITMFSKGETPINTHICITGHLSKGDGLKLAFQVLYKT